MQILDVVLVHEFAGPFNRLIQIFEFTSGILRLVLSGSGGQIRKGVVVAHMGLGVRGFDSEPVEHCQNGRRFNRGAVIVMQDGLSLTGGDALGESDPLDDACGMLSIVHLKRPLSQRSCGCRYRESDTDRTSAR